MAFLPSNRPMARALNRPRTLRKKQIMMAQRVVLPRTLFLSLHPFLSSKSAKLTNANHLSISKWTLACHGTRTWTHTRNPFKDHMQIINLAWRKHPVTLQLDAIMLEVFSPRSQYKLSKTSELNQHKDPCTIVIIKGSKHHHPASK